MFEIDTADELRNEGFVIDTPGKADWAIEKIKEARAQRDIFIAAADDKIEVLEQQKKSAADKCDRDIAFFMHGLDEYLETVPYKKAKTQISFDLPSGKLVRKLPSKVYKRNDAAIIEQLDGTEYVETIKKLSWANLKKALTMLDDGKVLNNETGEVIDGITVEDVPAVFDVK